MPRAFVSVGSNVDPETSVPGALSRLAEDVQVVAISTFYRTAPLGRPEQPAFYNGVVACETDRAPLTLRALLRAVEADLGRVRGPDRFAAREIDLDVIAYDALRLRTDELTLPDPDIRERAFLAVPLHEIAHDLPLPGFHETLPELARSFSGEPMEELSGFTRRLRKELLTG